MHGENESPDIYNITACEMINALHFNLVCATAYYKPDEVWINFNNGSHSM